jgi:hypothetical protein
MRPLTPSLALGCLELLGVIARNAPAAHELYGLRILQVSFEDLWELSQFVGWVEQGESSPLRLTPAGAVVASGGDARGSLRALLSAYVANAKPTWAQVAGAGRRELLMQAPVGIRQLFVESGMAYGYEEDVVAWWDQLATDARRVRDDAMTEIGRKGERLSFQYELVRTTHEPKWIGIESNLEGYDILSRVSSDDPKRLTIEVKTSQQPIEAAFFFLSRNEWEHAQDALNHAFHLWVLNGDRPLLAVLEVADVATHLPLDAGTGKWQNAKVPFKSFGGSFMTAAV